MKYLKLFEELEILFQPSGEIIDIDNIYSTDYENIKMEYNMKTLNDKYKRLFDKSKKIN